MKYYNTGESFLEAAGIVGSVRQFMHTTYKAHVRSGVVERGPIVLGYDWQLDNFIATVNDKGIRIHQLSYGTDDMKETTYDDAGRQLVQKEFKAGKLVRTTSMVYNTMGLCTECDSINADGTVQFKGFYTYDDRGLTLTNDIYMGHGATVPKRMVYTYNEAGKMLSLVSTKPDGQLEHSVHKTYDAHGNSVEEVSRYGPGQYLPPNKRTVYRYNDRNDCVQMIEFDMDGNELKNNTFEVKYDADGKRVTPQQDDTVAGQTEKVELDPQGNWVQKVTFHNKIPVKMEVRELVYFNEPECQLIHPITRITDRKGIAVEPIDKLEELTEAQANWLLQKSDFSPEQFPIVRYYGMRFKEAPSVVQYAKENIEALALLAAVTERFSALQVHVHYSNWDGEQRQLESYVLEFPYQKGYLLKCEVITAFDSSEYQVPEHIKQRLDDNLYLSAFQLLIPSGASANHNPDFEQELDDIIESNTLEKRPERPKISMIEVRGGQFVVVEHAVEDSFIIRDLDVNYGYGFQEFHTQLMQRFSTSSKGLVLFHGQPGTGKTYYIRHLLRQMAASNKRVIYMPPNMVDHLVDPTFMTFLINILKQWSSGGKSCVLLIEDAEPLLAKRQEGVRIQGVTNLLNMTDGLLNDMLNIQIICTFNVDLRKLDSALLRPGRLIARKEFKALSELDANLLAQRLGIKHHFKGPATLGEIYAKQKGGNTLIHDVDPNKGASSAIDDLM